MSRLRTLPRAASCLRAAADAAGEGTLAYACGGTGVFFPVSREFREERLELDSSLYHTQLFGLCGRRGPSLRSRLLSGSSFDSRERYYTRLLGRGAEEVPSLNLARVLTFRRTDPELSQLARLPERLEFIP
jgi:hypothetical protein